MEISKQQGFFGKDPLKFWLGKVVGFHAQAEQVSGQGWGWRFKVRIMGDYSEQDGIDDQNVVSAMCLVPTTAGSGGREMMQTPRISQGDTVLGIYMSDDEQGPAILAVLPRTIFSKDNGGKFDSITGYTENTTAGILEGQEYNEQDNILTPRRGIKGSGGHTTAKGNGTTRKTPTNALAKMGIDPSGVAKVGENFLPPGNLGLIAQQGIDNGLKGTFPKKEDDQSLDEGSMEGIEAEIAKQVIAQAVKKFSFGLFG